MRACTHIDCDTTCARGSSKGLYTCVPIDYLFTSWAIDWFTSVSARYNGYTDCRSPIKVHADERTRVHSAQSSLVVTHPSTNRARRYLTSVTESKGASYISARRDVLNGTNLSLLYLLCSELLQVRPSRVESGFCWTCVGLKQLFLLDSDLNWTCDLPTLWYMRKHHILY